MRIKEILQQQNMRQQDLADKIGVSLSAVKQMLNAESLTTSTLNKIANALEVPMWQLFASREEVLNDNNNDVLGVCPHCGKPIRIKVEKAGD